MNEFFRHFLSRHLAGGLAHRVCAARAISRGASPAAKSSVLRRAFTFTEVLFAVIILGVGFVMVAAILPVAIQQTSQGTDQTNSIAVSAAALRTLALSQTNQYCLFPPTDMQLAAGAFTNTPAAGAISLPSMPGKVYFMGDVTNPLYQPVYSNVAASQTNPPATNYPFIAYGTSSYFVSHYFLNGSIPDFRWNTQFNSVAGTMINSQDPRYAWVAFYQRGYNVTNASFIYTPSTGRWGYYAPLPTAVANCPITLQPIVKLTIITLHSRVRPTYSSASDMPFNFMPCQVDSGTGAPLPYYVEVFGNSTPSAKKPIWLSSTMPDQLQFLNTAGVNYDEPRAAQGAFVILSDDQYTGANNGHIFRLGTKHVENGATWWSLEEGYQLDSHLQSIERNTVSALNPTAYMIGRQLQSGAAAPTSANLSGAAQDVAIFQTSIPVQQ